MGTRYFEREKSGFMILYKNHSFLQEIDCEKDCFLHVDSIYEATIFPIDIWKKIEENISKWDNNEDYSLMKVRKTISIATDRILY